MPDEFEFPEKMARAHSPIIQCTNPDRVPGIPIILRGVERIFVVDEIAKTPPDQTGVYFLCREDLIVYVGITKNIVCRVRQQKKDKNFTHALFVPYHKEDLAPQEYRWIAKAMPEYNRGSSNVWRRQHFGLE